MDAGRTAENPLVPGLFAEPVAIAKISGTTVFNPSQWRLVNTGVKNLGGEFRLVGDTVYLQALVSTGMIIMVF